MYNINNIIIIFVLIYIIVGFYLLILLTKLFKRGIIAFNLYFKNNIRFELSRIKKYSLSFLVLVLFTGLFILPRLQLYVSIKANYDYNKHPELYYQPKTIDLNNNNVDKNLEIITFNNISFKSPWKNIKKINQDDSYTKKKLQESTDLPLDKLSIKNDNRQEFMADNIHLVINNGMNSNMYDSYISRNIIIDFITTIYYNENILESKYHIFKYIANISPDEVNYLWPVNKIVVYLNLLKSKEEFYSSVSDHYYLFDNGHIKGIQMGKPGINQKVSLSIYDQYNDEYNIEISGTGLKQEDIIIILSTLNIKKRSERIWTF